MTEDRSVTEVVSGLLATAGNEHERRAIAELADAGLFADRHFRRTCLSPREPRTMRWNVLLLNFGRFNWKDARYEAMERALIRVKLVHASTPQTLEELQVAIDLDHPDGLVLAAWRDEYAADGRDPNPYHHLIDLCLDELRERFECWNCGRQAVDTRDGDLPVCDHHKEGDS